MFPGVNIRQVQPATRSTFHHGDLRNALLQAGAQLAEQGGPSAVTIRAAARLAGVTPTAAYRHFADHAELLGAVRRHAIDELAAAIARRVRQRGRGLDPGPAAMRRLLATGRGYVDFAVAQPGLFRTAFFRGKPAGSGPPDPNRPGSPFGMLNQALDHLVTTGHLPPQNRPTAEITAWAAVHGLALLIIDGPLHALPAKQRNQAIDRTLTTVLRGLTCTERPGTG